MAYSDTMSARLRLTALLGVGAFGLHQLRYLLAHGEESGAALAREGHAYLGMLVPLVAILLGAAALDFGIGLLRARHEGPSAKARWIAISTALLCIYVCQESFEGVLVAQHESGLAAVVGSGGWMALPLGVAIGGIVALLLRGAQLAIAARRRTRPCAGSSLGPLAALPDSSDLQNRNLLARHLAGRAPPSHCCS